MKIFFLRILRRLGLFRFLKIKLRKIYANHVIIIPLSNGLGFENMILKEDWLDELLKIIPLKEDDAFLDAGVNLGQSLIKLRTADKRIKYLGFEPNPVCFNYTQELINVNAFSNCRINNKALFNIDSKLKLQLDYNYDSRASVIENQRPGMMKNSVTVDAIALDQHFNNEKIGIIKIDVEGAELEVLLGMEKSIAYQRPVIICEILDSYSDDVHKFTCQRAAEVFALLQKHKYNCYKIILSESDYSIAGIEVQDGIHLKLWEEKSLFANDYIFIPEENVYLKGNLIDYLRNKQS